jgi:hypothetical protein
MGATCRRHPQAFKNRAPPFLAPLDCIDRDPSGLRQLPNRSQSHDAAPCLKYLQLADLSRQGRFPL